MLRAHPYAGGLAVGAVAIALATAGCSTDTLLLRASGPEAQSALAGQSFYVDPHSAPSRQAALWRSQRRERAAAAMERLARQPAAEWLTDDHDITGRVQSLTQRAAQAGRSALLVAYHLPGRDCGGYSVGGARTGASYRRWISALARGIADRPTTVIVEPDAVAQAMTHCLRGAKLAQRYELLRFAVNTLAARPQVHVYLDAGNPGWIQPSSRLADPLRRAGIHAADGFALNTSSFYRTAQNIRYGRELADVLGGAHFVIDTSRNGNGAGRDHGGSVAQWCNPAGRALGVAPTTATGRSLVDAYLWIKSPGRSDGACGRGAPPAGQWWPEYALALVRNAS